MQDRIESAEDRRPGLHRMGRFGPAAHLPGRHDEEFPDLDATGIARAGLQRHQHQQGHQHRARPVGDLRQMEGEPAGQQHDLHRHHRHAAPGNDAEEGEQATGEDIAGGGAAMGEDRLAGAAHMRRIDGIADGLEREIGLHAGADVEGALVEKRPAAMGALDAAQIDGDLCLHLRRRRFAQIVLQQDIFSRESSRRPRARTPNARQASAS